MTRIRKRLEIDAGHRLLNHEGKCRNLHGHRYAFEVECEAPSLDEVGRIVDFSVVKERVGGWLDREWDHAVILHPDDPLLPTVQELGLKHFVADFPSTAEILAEFVFEMAAERLKDTGVTVTAVTCYETPTSSATFRRDP